jgi:molybdopterin converting factor small subunit
VPDQIGSGLRIRVCFYNIVADLVGRRVEERWMPEGSVIADLLQVLAAEYPALRHYAHTGDPPSPNPLRLFRNGRIVVNTGDRLTDKDEIRIFPIISGG